MTAIDVEVQVSTAPQVDVDVQIAPPTFTVVSVLPTGPRGPAGPAGADSTVPGPQGDQGDPGQDGADGQDGSDGAPGQGVPTGGTDGQVLTKTSGVDFATAWEAATGGVQSVVAGSNIDVDATDPANPVVSVETLVDADIPASIARDSEVAAGYQPLDADLTALAAAGNSAVLAATTASFLTADETKLDGIEAGAQVNEVTQAELDAEAALARNADNLTSGTVADARIAATIARDSEVAAAVADLIAGDGSIETIVALTQAEYDAIGTPDATTYYIITDATGGASVQSVDGLTGDVVLSTLYTAFPLRDTLANLAANNPVLATGRLAIATDSSPLTFAIGDGATAWNSLPKFEERTDPVRAETTVAQAGIAAVTDRTGLSVTFTVGTVPWVVESCEPYVFSSAAGVTPSVAITDAANTDKAQVYGGTAGGASYFTAPIICRERITAAGTYTRKVRVSKVGAGSVTYGSGAAVNVSTIVARPER